MQDQHTSNTMSSCSRDKGTLLVTKQCPPLAALPLGPSGGEDLPEHVGLAPGPKITTISGLEKVANPSHIVEAEALVLWSRPGPAPSS